jgi:hypothetical protein
VVAWCMSSPWCRVNRCHRHALYRESRRSCAARRRANHACCHAPPPTPSSGSAPDSPGRASRRGAGTRLRRRR